MKAAGAAPVLFMVALAFTISALCPQRAAGFAAAEGPAVSDAGNEGLDAHGGPSLAGTEAADAPPLQVAGLAAANQKAPVQVSFLDPADDLFDSSGRSVKDLPYLDIASVGMSVSAEECVATIRLKGPLPLKTPDPQIFLEWTVYVDSDGNPGNGGSWPLVTNNLSYDYMARLMLLDSSYRAQLFEAASKKSSNISYSIDRDTVELRWPGGANPSGSFRFTVAAKKYGERGAGSAFMLADKAPDANCCRYPEGIVLDIDKDGFTDDEEQRILGTDPNVAEKWNDFKFASRALSSPEKVCLYLDRKFRMTNKPSQLFEATPAQLFAEMGGDCDEFALLAVYWLGSAGYKAYMLDVAFDAWWPEYNTWKRHDVCAYKKDGAWYLVDVYYLGTGKNPLGPYASPAEACGPLPAHYGASGWTSYRLYDISGKAIEQVINK